MAWSAMLELEAYDLLDLSSILWFQSESFPLLGLL